MLGIAVHPPQFFANPNNESYLSDNQNPSSDGHD